MLRNLFREAEVLPTFDQAKLTIADLRAMTIEALDQRSVAPDDGKVWGMAESQLRNEARRVKGGDQRDLSDQAQGWLLDIVSNTYRLTSERQLDAVIRARLGP